MRLVHIRAGSDEDATCLMRELAVYSPKHLRRTVVIELEERSHTDLLALRWGWSAPATNRPGLAQEDAVRSRRLWCG